MEMFGGGGGYITHVTYGNNQIVMARAMQPICWPHSNDLLFVIENQYNVISEVLDEI
jgi:hypothetical protein